MRKRLLNDLSGTWNRIIFWIAGFFAFLWIILRSGTNPKRLAYPCQQAAFPLASSWFIAFGAVLAGAFTLRALINGSVKVLLLIAITWISLSSSRNAPAEAKGNYPVWKSVNPVSKIFVFENIPPTSGSLAAGNASVPNGSLNDPGIDSLIRIMEHNGTWFHRSASHPDGIVGASDIVIIKPNFQWRGRLSTNTDRIKGVIWKILSHPDGFTGEIIIADNGSEQIQPASYFCGFSEYANNSDDLNQSILDVINVFKAKGHPVDYFMWDDLNYTLVSEYSASDLRDGYVYNSTSKVNYPKFKTPKGSYVSLKHGIWNNTSKQYDATRLTIINMPVLKAHEMGGATVAVKNWVGVMNQANAESWYGGYDQFHYNYVFKDFALPAKVINETWPEFSIVDATYVATRNNYEPGSPVVKANTLLASSDPVAVSWYAAKYILKPVAVFPDRVDPDNLSNGFYGTNLNYWYNYLKNNTTRGVTKDPTKISVFGNKDVLTDVKELSEQISPIIAFPNPSLSGIFTIRFGQEIEPGLMSVTSSNGVCILNVIPDDAEFQLDLSRYPGGIYYVTFPTSSLLRSIKIVKLR